MIKKRLAMLAVWIVGLSGAGLIVFASVNYLKAGSDLGLDVKSIFEIVVGIFIILGALLVNGIVSGKKEP
ncbi:MAG: hypothetical protein V1742_12645 [Pseudomonadota bacterium]